MHALVISAGQLIQGVYSVRVTTSQGIYVRKIIRFN
jgi:hypothetical protein